MVEAAQEKIERDVSLVLHRWMPARPRGVIFYVHGIQSNASWLFESGPFLASREVAVYVLDRRGSGVSGGARGDVRSYAEWIDDYLAAMEIVRARHRDVKMLLLGQSFGGIVASGIAIDPRATHDALLLCAPGINTKCPFTEEQLERMSGQEAPLSPIRLTDDQYTEDPRYLAFMKHDATMVRAVTPRFSAARFRLDQRLMSRRGAFAGRPCTLVLPKRDRIVDLVRAREGFELLSGGAGRVVESSAEDHYVEFSSYREQFLELLASFFS
jgi:alpha-beta hydrolase superfamily lysophospholipase